ncbi:MAG: hypothetical protein ACPH9Z_05655, partial [Luminiphilus sp.]
GEGENAKDAQFGDNSKVLRPGKRKEVESHATTYAWEPWLHLNPVGDAYYLASQQIVPTESDLFATAEASNPIPPLFAPITFLPPGSERVGGEGVRPPG